MHSCGPFDTEWRAKRFTSSLHTHCTKGLLGSKPILTWWQTANCLPPMGIKHWPLKTICTAERKDAPVHAIEAYGGVEVQLHIPAT